MLLRVVPGGKFVFITKTIGHYLSEAIFANSSIPIALYLSF